MTSFDQFLNEKKSHFNEALISSFTSLGETSRLREAVEYALSSGGKRFRPLLVLLISEALQAPREPMEAALAVEYFHTASLIADDLPCMDNDDERRGKAALHCAFDESTALLASYALITAAFEKIAEAGEPLKRGGELVALALKEAARLAGIKGATSGQYFDLFPPRNDLETLKKIFYLKTVTLFELSFLLGWIFGGGDRSKIERVRLLSHHFGMAFQIADDVRDYAQDKERKSLNLAHAVGIKESLTLFREEICSVGNLLKELSLETPALVGIVELLKMRIPQEQVCDCL